MGGKISVGLRMDPEKAELLKRAAKDDHRTVASLLDKLVDEYLRAHDYLGAERESAPPPMKPKGRR